MKKRLMFLSCIFVLIHIFVLFNVKKCLYGSWMKFHGPYQSVGMPINLQSDRAIGQELDVFNIFLSELYFLTMRTHQLL